MPRRIPTLRTALPATALLAGLFIVLSDPALAQASDTGGTIDRAIKDMAETLQSLGDTLGHRAQQFMLSLLLIEFVWRGGKWVIQGQGLDEFAQPMIYTIGIVSLVWLFADVVPDVVKWLADMAIKISGELEGDTDVSAAGLVSDGLTRAVEWINAMDRFRPSTWLYLFSAIIAIITLAITVAMYVVIYAELYLVGLAGIITLGFAGLSETRQIATSYIMMLVGKAFRLMGLLIIIAATHELTLAIARADDAGFENAMVVILLQVITVILILTLPSTLERLISGSRLSSNAAEGAARGAGKGAASAMAAAGGGALGAGVGAVAGAMAAKSAGGSMVGGALKAGASRGLNWGNIAARGQVGATIMQSLQSRLGGR